MGTNERHARREQTENGEQAGRAGREVRPDPDWVRGDCPRCGEDLVANCYYVAGRGYLMIWECWASLGEGPTCDYRRVL